MEEVYYEDFEEFGPAIGDAVEDFEIRVYNPENGEIEEVRLSDFAGKYLVLFFYPADFTFVCPTELKELNDMYEEFKKEGAEILAISKDTVYTHKAWVETEPLLKGFRIRMAEDRAGILTDYFGIEDIDGNSLRATFIIDPEGILRAVEIVEQSIGRSAKELLRKIKAIKFVTENPGKVCPASSDGSKHLEPDISKAGHVGEDLS